MSWFRRDDDKVILNIYVQPGAKHHGVHGLYGDALKIRLSAPAIDGRANAALVTYLAVLFDVPARQVSIKQGNKSRSKVAVIIGSKTDPEYLFKTLLSLT